MFSRKPPSAVVAIWSAIGVVGLSAGIAVSVPASAQTLAIPELRTTLGIDGGDDVSRSQGDVGELGSGTGPDTLLPPLTAPGDAAASPGADGSDNREDEEEAPAPAPSFDLFEGPQTPASAFPAAEPAEGGEPAAPENQAARRVEDPLATGTLNAATLRTDTLEEFLPVNPPLAAGVAGEALGAQSALRTNTRLAAQGQIFRRPASDPFAPTGIRAGRYILFPELVETIGASSNIDDEADGETGLFSETTLSARLLSDWSRNEAELNSSFTYRRNFAGENPEDPRAAVDGRLRIDVDRLTTATLRGALDYRRDDPVDIAQALRGTGGRPEVLNYSFSGQLAREFGRLTLSGTASAAREDVSRLDAGVLDQSYTTLTGTLRAAYELSPALSPFLEASLGRRLFDVKATGGSASIGRDSVLPSARAGVAVDIAEKLAGEVAVGYAVNTPDDGSADTTGAPTLDANLVWSPRRGTDVTLVARSRFEPESSGRSTTANYEAGLALRHILTARTDLTAALTAEFSDSTLSQSDETLFTGELGLTYFVSREVSLIAGYVHRDLFSQIPGEDYSSDTVRVGVRFRR